MSGGTGEVGTSVSTSSQNSLVRAESVQGTVFQAQGDHTSAFTYEVNWNCSLPEQTIFHDQIQSQVLDEVVAVVTQRLSVERVQQGMTSSIRDGSTTVRLST